MQKLGNKEQWRIFFNNAEFSTKFLIMLYKIFFPNTREFELCQLFK